VGPSKAVVFPDVDAQPRRPSQLYEAGLEGLFLLLVLAVIAWNGGLKRPGLAMGACILGYGLARIAMEFFREPDPELEQLAHGLTMGNGSFHPNGVRRRCTGDL
jgi:phosphatidylglycerol:prolipoprotein diacylglycerol transferase